MKVYFLIVYCILYICTKHSTVLEHRGKSQMFLSLCVIQFYSECCKIQFWVTLKHYDEAEIIYSIFPFVNFPLFILGIFGGQNAGHFKCGKNYEDNSPWCLVLRHQCISLSSINNASLRTLHHYCYYSLLANKALALYLPLLICVIWIISRLFVPSKANYHDLVNGNDFATQMELLLHISGMSVGMLRHDWIGWRSNYHFYSVRMGWF